MSRLQHNCGCSLGVRKEASPSYGFWGAYNMIREWPYLPPQFYSVQLFKAYAATLVTDQDVHIVASRETNLISKQQRTDIMHGHHRETTSYTWVRLSCRVASGIAVHTTQQAPSWHMYILACIKLCHGSIPILLGPLQLFLLYWIKINSSNKQARESQALATCSSLSMLKLPIWSSKSL